MADDLKFGIDLEPNLDAFEKSWKQQEDKIQSIIDRHEFKIKITGVADLDKIEAQLKRINEIQRQTNKPMTAYRAAQIDIQREVALRNQQATQMQLVNIMREKESQEIQKTAKIRAQAEAAQIRLNNAQEKGVATTNAQTRAFQAQSGVLTGLRQFMNSYLSILGAYRLVNNIKDITAQFELQRVSLMALTQDAEFADTLFNRIKATAIESPFSVKQMITYTKQLAAYRVENEKLYDTMNMLADMSAGLGVDMNRLILAYGQVKAASVLRGQELRQFTESGIPLVDLLAVKFSQLRNEVVSTGEVFNLISKRQVPFQMIADIFEEMTTEGGRFYNMQKKQAESLYGVYENLKDNIQIAMDEVGQANRGLLMGAGKVFTELAKHLQDIIDLLGIAATTFIAYKIATIAASQAEKGLALSKTLVTTANAALTKSEVSATAARSAAVFVLDEAIATHNVYAACVARAALANNVFTRTFWKLAAAVAANPIVAAITGITAAVAIGTTAYKKHIEKLRSADEAQKRVAKSTAEAAEVQKEQVSTLKQYTKTIEEQDALVKSQGRSLTEFAKIWPELAKKYKDDIEYQKALDAASENRKKAIESLQNQYSGYFDYLDAEKFKIDDLTRGYVAYTDQLRDAERARLEAQRDTLQSKIAKREGELGALAGVNSEDMKWWMSPNGLAGLGSWLISKGQVAELEGWREELAEVERQIISVGDAQKLANIANVNWRQVYKKNVEPTLEDEKLAQTDMQTAIDNTRKKYKAATLALLSYKKAVATLQAKLKQATGEDAKKIQADIDDIEKSIKDTEKEIEGQKTFSSYLGFGLEDSKSGENTALKNLKNEYSLVEQIYKRYTQLKKSMSDTSAQKKITEIYGKLFEKKGGINFLSTDGLKKKLKEFQDKASKLGDKDLALKIGLAIQDIEFDNLKKELQKRLDSIAKQISRSKAGADLFQSFLGLTGNEELSTNLTIALTGIDITGQDIRTQLADQLANIIGDESIAPEVTASLNISQGDGESSVDYIARIREMIKQGQIDVAKFDALINSLGDKDLKSKLESALKEYLDYNTSMLQDFFKTINKSGTDSAQRGLLTSKKDAGMKNATIIDQLKPDNIDMTAWKQLIKDYTDAIQKEYDNGIAKLDFEAFKKKFSEPLANMDAASVNVLSAMIKELKGFLSLPGIDATMMKSIQEIIEKAENVRIDRAPLDTLAEAWRDLIRVSQEAKTAEAQAAKEQAISAAEANVNAAKEKLAAAKQEVKSAQDELSTAKEQEKAATGEAERAQAEAAVQAAQAKVQQARATKQAAQEELNLANAAKIAAKNTTAASKSAAINKMKKSVASAKKQWDTVTNAIDAVIDATEEVADALGLAFSDETQDAIDGFRTGVRLVTVAFTVFAAILAVVEAEVATLETLLWPLLVVALAVGAAFAAIKWFSGKKARDAEAAIKSYDKHIKVLERHLDRLQEIQEQMLGSEWIANQNQQIDDLKAKIKDIDGKIAAERKQKKKDIDEDKIADWEDEKLEAEKQIRELSAAITEEMAGTDLTSAAKEFAEAWLDAYLEFGNTTDAIKEKFKDMMKNMVVNSVLARVVQQKLKPIFDYIDNQLYDKEGNMIGSLNTVWSMMKSVTDTLPGELEAIYTNMGSWAGELRATESELTGISKGVAQASEESVVTLSGYANSILYYHVQEATDIAAIRAILEGKTIVSTNTSQPSSESGSVNIGQLISLQQDLLAQVVLIKNDTGAIREDITDIKDTLRSVVSGAGSQSPKTINIRYRQ